MTRHERHFDEKKPKAVLKHAALKYLYPFATMTSTWSDGRRVWFIDAYAGAGRFRDGSDGSPLIAIRAANALSKMDPPRDLRCIFIERKRAYFDQLTEVANATAEATPPVVIHGDCASELGRAVRLVKDDPLLTFLDPFGAALPRQTMVDLLMRRRGKSEVLLNFHLGTVARIGACITVGGELTDEDRKTAQRLDAFLGYGEWREVFNRMYRKGDDGSATNAALSVSAQYRRRIFDDTGYRSFVVPIRDAPTHRPEFQLTLFFTGDTPAEYKFADAASHANAAWRKRISELAAREDALRHPNTLFDSEFSEKQFEHQWRADEERLEADWIAALKENILQATQSGVPVLVRTHVPALFGAHLGFAGERHLRAAWRALFEEGLVGPVPKDLQKGTLVRAKP